MTVAKRWHDEVHRDRLRSHLEWFAGVRRDTGGQGEDAAVEYLTAALAAEGVPHRVHEFDAYLSYPREAVLRTLSAGGRDFSCVTHSFTRSTPNEGLRGSLRYLPNNDFSDAAGQIVLVDGLCTPITVLEASRAGVRAIVFANQGDVVHNMIGTTIWGTPSADQLDRLPNLAAVSISRPDGAALKAELERGAVEIEMRTRVETGWYRSKLPEVVIEPGASQTSDEFVLIGAHYCSWEVGITDNATGDACLLELARILHQGRGALRRGVRICWWPGHSQGRYSGSTWYADTFFHELADRCIAYHNIDSPGVKGATMYVARHTTAEVESFCTGVIAAVTGQQEPPIHRPSRAADQSFLANGVPAFSTYPFLPDGHPDRKAWTGGCANAWWWHSSHDTLDKADLDILAQDTRVSLSAIDRLANADLLPIDPSAASSEILGYANEFVAATVGHLQAAHFAAAAEALHVATSAFLAEARTLRDPEALRHANGVLMGLSRILLPVTYTKGGRFVHDPAEWSPIMRNTKSSLFPGLNPGMNLPELDGSDSYGFVRAGVVRHLNRTVDALRHATQVCEQSLRSLATPST
jgi:N-acetylated-alpha-linked acidic dipeptidase